MRTSRIFAAGLVAGLAVFATIASADPTDPTTATPDPQPTVTATHEEQAKADALDARGDQDDTAEVQVLAEPTPDVEPVPSPADPMPIGEPVTVDGVTIIADPISPFPTDDEAQPEPPILNEDDPRWDCRVMGNQICGFEVQGTRYLVAFAAGVPVQVFEDTGTW